MPTIKEMLLKEFEYAIYATFGSKADKKIDSGVELDGVLPITIEDLAAADKALKDEVDPADILEIARKVNFYIFD